MTVLTWFLRASRSLMAASYLNLPKSMSLATGGFAIGATSTRSRSDSAASRNASSTRTMPTCSPLGPTNRTSGTRMRSLIRGSLMWFSLVIRQGRPLADEKSPSPPWCTRSFHDKEQPTKTAGYDGWRALVIRCTSATAHHWCDAPAGRTWNPAAADAANCDRADAGGSNLSELLLHAAPVGEPTGFLTTQPVKLSGYQREPTDCQSWPDTDPSAANPVRSPASSSLVPGPESDELPSAGATGDTSTPHQRRPRPRPHRQGRR